jgi:hypothetical protein
MAETTTPPSSGDDTGGRRLALTVGVVAVIAVCAVLLVVLAGRGAEETADVGPLGAGGVPEGTVEVPIDAATHVSGDVDYDTQPPAGGPHDPAWQNCGVYAEPVRAEHVVHSMEHGAVWITYGPARIGAADIEDQLGGRPYVVVSPLPQLGAPVVATAWGYQLQLDGLDDPRLDAFMRQFVQGPQTPEPGAPCTGGVGEPVA